MAAAPNVGPVLASVATFALEGVRSREVTVEVDSRSGLHIFTLVGLPDRAVRESRDRVRAALLNSGLEFPTANRLTANLAPAHLRKAGPSFDLAIAVGVLVATGQVPSESLERSAVCGELSLSGELRPVRGALAAALGARASGKERLIVPVENGPEAALVEGLDVLGVPDLPRLADLLHGRWTPEPAVAVELPAPSSDVDLAEVRGQADAKRALVIAAAGGHNVLMVGPPGAGKTMLARRLSGILPPPDFGEALEITQIHSAAGVGGRGLMTERPFRAPHHTTSAQGLVGGGTTPRPGEVTLAHRGVLFLDELAEFKRDALDALRQPLEDGRVEIVRGQRMVDFPARTMLVAACNPCPCAKPPDRCVCGPLERGRYARRVSGPLLDRIDLACQVEAVPLVELVDGRRAGGPSSEEIRGRVLAARQRQRRRLEGTGLGCNGEMDSRMTRRLVRIHARAYYRSRVAGSSAHAATTGCSVWLARSLTSTGAIASRPET